MEIKRIWKIYFSATGTTEKIVSRVADELGIAFSIKPLSYNFTTPDSRNSFPDLTCDDLVVFGCPTYAGRLPNLLLKYLNSICGNDALAVPVVTFGNRAFDNSLIELRNILENNGFHTIAAGAFSCEHSFSYKLGAGRPDAEDLKFASKFSFGITGKLAKILTSGVIPEPIQVSGDASADYYKPRDRHGVFIDIRKVKPKTSDKCTDCGLCADLCPMGAIDYYNVRNINGICIKCGACIKKCPNSAKYFDDEGYLYHKKELESMYGSERQSNTMFL